MLCAIVRGVHPADRDDPEITRRKFVVTLGASAMGVALAGCGCGPSRGRAVRAEIVTTPGSLERVVVDARTSVGPYARLSGVQGSPLPVVPDDTDHTAQFHAYRIENVRVDQDCPPNTLTLGGIFPDENADPDRPESYDFRAIDRHLAASRAAGAAVLWQSSYDVGRSDSWKGLNLGGRAPRDLERWSRVIRRCLEHFNSGWGGGAGQRAVASVEFLNEPDGLGGFDGGDGPRLLPVFERFLDTVAAFGRDHPAAAAPAVGPGIPLSWAEWPRWAPRFEQALATIAGHGRTIPVFSFHTYGDDTSPVGNAHLARAFRALLDRHGMQSTPLWNTEWQAGDFLERHLGVDRTQATSITRAERLLWASALATYALSCKARWQGVVAGSYHYRATRRAFPPGRGPAAADNLGLGGFFSPTGRVGALALHEGLTQRIAELLPERCPAEFDDDGELTVLGARSPDARRAGALLCNLSPRARAIELILTGLAPGARNAARVVRLDIEHSRLAEHALDPEPQPEGRVALRLTLPPLASALALVG